ncbi:hypothetical protein TNCV_2544031 [Trichonephila clavipes]|nr:hypothetical protein TNCV_2544031 [Trichonephila clavipes]
MEWGSTKILSSSRGSTKAPSSSRGSTKAPSSSRGTIMKSTVEKRKTDHKIDPMKKLYRQTYFDQEN